MFWRKGETPFKGGSRILEKNESTQSQPAQSKRHHITTSQNKDTNAADPNSNLEDSIGQTNTQKPS